MSDPDPRFDEVEEEPDPRVVGVVLAAGAARRFGSPKQLAELDGIPLVVHAVEAQLAVPALSEVLVITGSHGREVAHALAGLEDVRVLRCARWEEGMAASLRTGIAAAREDRADLVLLTLADQPRITPQVIAMVMDHALDVTPPAPARATYGGVPGHPVALPAALFSKLMALEGDAGARELLADPRVRVRTAEAGHLCDPTDVDTPEALEALR